MFINGKSFILICNWNCNIFSLPFPYLMWLLDWLPFISLLVCLFIPFVWLFFLSCWPLFLIVGLSVAVVWTLTGCPCYCKNISVSAQNLLELPTIAVRYCGSITYRKCRAGGSGSKLLRALGYTLGQNTESDPCESDPIPFYRYSRIQIPLNAEAWSGSKLS